MNEYEWHYTVSRTIQTVLDIPELNKTETRRNLAKLFGVYRRYRALLKMGQTPEVFRFEHESLDGYEYAMDPDLIRGSSFGSKALLPHEDVQSVRMKAFIRDMDFKLDGLPSVEQPHIIRYRFLFARNPLPTDAEVQDILRQKKLGVSPRTYDRMKAEALLLLAGAYGVEVEAEEQT